MSTALEGEEYVPARQQDFKMATWIRACIATMASEVGTCPHLHSLTAKLSLSQRKQWLCREYRIRKQKGCLYNSGTDVGFVSHVFAGGSAGSERCG